MLKSLRNGDWLTAERIRLVCIMLVAGYALAMAVLFATSDGRLDRMGRPLGTDFSQVWVAGKFVLEGNPAAPFDPLTHEIRQRQEFSESSGFFHWGYPPFFLLVAGFFALFPYALALVLWQLTTLPLYMAAVARAAPFRSVLLAAAAFPAVFINLGHGHNGFLSAGLLGFGVILLKSRPWLAGLLIGLMAYKPQFGLLLPLALIAGRHWAAFAGAALTVVALSLLTWAMFGAETWAAFFQSLEYSRSYVAEQGAAGWHKIQSVFAMARLWGAPLWLAYAIHAAGALVSAAAVIALWSARADWRLCGAALMCGSILATPYALDYDMMLLGPAIALYAAYGAEKGFRTWEKSFLAALWFAPLIARTLAQVTHIHLGVILMGGFMYLIYRRGQQDRGIAAH